MALELCPTRIWFACRPLGPAIPYGAFVTSPLTAFVACLTAIGLAACSSTVVVTDPPAEDAGAADDPADANPADMAAARDAAGEDGGGPDGAPADATAPDLALPPGAWLRIVSAARAPVEAELLVASALGSRRVTTERLRLTEAELEAGVDVYALASGYELAGIVALRTTTLLLLPRVEDDAAFVLTPTFFTDPTPVRVSPPSFVIGVPLGHGGGGWAATSGGPTVETPGLDGLILGFSAWDLGFDATAPGPCGLRFTLDDRRAIERILPISPESDPRFAPQPCETQELRVTLPPDFEPYDLRATVLRRAPFATGYVQSPALLGGSSDEAPASGSTWTLPMRGLPSDLPVRDHPAARLPVEVVVRALGEVGSEAVSSVAVLPWTRALREGVSLPAPDTGPTASGVRHRVRGLEERGTDPIAALPANPLPVEPPFTTFVQLRVGRLTLLVAPGPTLPLTRALRSVASLAGVESWAPFDQIAVEAGVCADLEFDPVASCNAGGPFAFDVGFLTRAAGMELFGSLTVPVALFAPESA